MRKKLETVRDKQIFLGSKITADGDCSHVTKGLLLLGRKPMTKLDSVLKSRDISFPTKVCLVKVMVFPVVLYGCEIWIIKKTENYSVIKIWCFWTVVLEMTLQSPLDCKKFKPANSKGNQPLIFTGRADADAEASILQPPDANSQLIGKDPDSGKDWGQEEKGTTEDEMRELYHWLNGKVWANSGKWWRRGKPGMLQSMGSQRVDLLVTEQQVMTR